MTGHPRSPADRIIVPLDVASEADAYTLIEKLPQVSFWKVGLELFVSTGPILLERLKAAGKQIFLDLKFHDIPNTVAGACRAASQYGVQLMTLHATAGPTALQAAASAAQAGHRSVREMPQLIAVTLLTSIDERSLALDLKVPLELSDYTLQMALLAKQNGLTGSVCSPHEARLLRRWCGKEWLLVCPGVRPTWSQPGDQRRVMTPSQAVKAGADYLVIGRPITQSANPSEAFQTICDEIATVVESKL
ncbi:MAG: orotidine-5'-phosphate decarboxylase [Leptolyngbyaceae cyanobacterium]